MFSHALMAHQLEEIQRMTVNSSLVQELGHAKLMYSFVKMAQNFPDSPLIVSSHPAHAQELAPKMLKNVQMVALLPEILRTTASSSLVQFQSNAQRIPLCVPMEPLLVESHPIVSLQHVLKKPLLVAPSM